MGKALTLQEFKKECIAKHGVCTIIGKYVNKGTVTLHQCTQCPTKFLATPGRILRKMTITCIPCAYKIANNQKAKIKPKAEFIAILKSKFPNVRCLNYKTNHTKAKFKCKCGHEWPAVPYQVTQLKHGCPKCARLEFAKVMTKPIEEYKVLLFEKNPTIKLLSRNRKPGEKVSVRCTTCKYVWDASLGNLIHNQTGCPRCAKFNQYNLTTKSIQLNGKSVSVQGYEDIAIDHLLTNRNVPASKIKVFSEGKINPVDYVYMGFQKEYWPDIQIGKTIIEVKSIYTLTAEWEKNKAKAKACIKEGFNFKLYLVNLEGKVHKVHVLPKNWLSWKVEDANVFLRRKTVKKLRILSMDPGTSNFAWSVLEVSRPMKIKIVATGMLQNTLKEMTVNMTEPAILFQEEIMNIVEEYAVDNVILERFMSRGMKGVTIELVNIMIGYLIGLLRKKANMFKLITAAQWKNEWNRHSNLKEFYTKVGCTVHQVDAIGIGIYGAAYWFDEKPFTSIKDLERSLVKQIKLADINKQ